MYRRSSGHTSRPDLAAAFKDRKRPLPRPSAFMKPRRQIGWPNNVRDLHPLNGASSWFRSMLKTSNVSTKKIVIYNACIEFETMKNWGSYILVLFNFLQLQQNLSHVHQVSKDIVGSKGFEALTQAPTTSLHPRSQGSQVNNQAWFWHHTLAFCRFATGNCKLHPVRNWRLTDYGMIRFFISQKFYGCQRHSFNQHSFRVCFEQEPVLPCKPQTSKQVLATNLPVSPSSDANLWIEAKSDANPIILPRQQCWSRSTGGNWYLDGWVLGFRQEINKDMPWKP